MRVISLFLSFWLFAFRGAAAAPVAAPDDDTFFQNRAFPRRSGVSARWRWQWQYNVFLVERVQIKLKDNKSFNAKKNNKKKKEKLNEIQKQKNIYGADLILEKGRLEAAATLTCFCHFWVPYICPSCPPCSPAIFLFCLSVDTWRPLPQPPPPPLPKEPLPLSAFCHCLHLARNFFVDFFPCVCVCVLWLSFCFCISGNNKRTT